MASNTPESPLARYRERADTAVRQALIDAGELPIYGMLRYFMGYENERGEQEAGMAGKRIRASLTLLTADLFGGGASADDLAVAVELFHNFTLIHDDIEDNDEMRRGRGTVWKIWGIDHGINAGDAQAFLTTEYLLRASAHDVRGVRAAQVLVPHFREVIEGQYLDFELAKKSITDPQVTVAAYLEMIRKKTSVLVGAAVAAGGVAAGCDASTRDALFTYGESLGMAYQIADDMASVWGDERETGKRAYGDLIERKKTYPVLYARDHGAGARFEALYNSPEELSAQAARELVALLDTVGACEATRACGESYLAHAYEAVQALPIAQEQQEELSSFARSLVRFAPHDHVVD